MAGEQTAALWWVFKNGKLLHFEPNEVLVLRQWPHCAAWAKRGDGPWRGTRPRSQCISHIVDAAACGYVEHRWQNFLRWQRKERAALLAPERADELELLRQRLIAGWTTRHLAAKDFIETFPPAALELVVDLPERQWHLIQLLARCPGALDLATTCRGLAVALASNWVFHAPAVQRPLRAARSLVRARRPLIAGWLGFPATRSAVSVLGKVHADALRMERLLWLRSTLLEPDPPKELQHLPVLTAPVLRVLCDARLRRSAAPSLLEELASSPDPRKHAFIPRVLRDLLDAARLAGIRTPLVVRSVAELHTRHDEVTRAVNRRGLRDVAALELPAAPIAGTDAIVPLTSAAEVIDEGRAMHHCVATYARRVAAGTTYIYRVLAPERATLSITRAATGSGWKIEQISGVANGPVGHETRLSVSAWLRASGMGWGPQYGAARSLDELYGGDDIPY